MRPDIEKLKSQIDAKSTSIGSRYHTSRNEVKLHFYTKYVDHAQKCRLVELTRAENDFKRKYSGYLEDGKNATLLTRRSLLVARVLSENKCLRKYSNPRRDAFTHDSQEKKMTSQESEPDGGTFNPTGISNSRIESRPDTGMTMSSAQSSRPSIRLSTPPSHTYNRRSSLQGPVLAGRGTSTLDTMRRMSCPTTRRKPSTISPYSNDRLSQLEALWDRVFKLDDVEDDSYIGQKARKQERTARERFSGIVLQQFKVDEKRDVARKPLKGKERNLDVMWHSTPRTYTHNRSTFRGQRIPGSRDEDGSKNEWKKANAFNFVKDKNIEERFRR